MPSRSARSIKLPRRGVNHGYSNSRSIPALYLCALVKVYWLTFTFTFTIITMYGASSCADGGENHLTWRISEYIFEYAAADLRQVVVLALGACYVEGLRTWTNAEAGNQWQLLVTGL